MDIRKATINDIEFIKSIYNQGIEDKIATLESDVKDNTYIENWLFDRSEKYSTLVLENENQVLGFATINPYNSRCAYSDVGEISIYIERENRGKGYGTLLLSNVVEIAKTNKFHKLVLFALEQNKAGNKLYEKVGFNHVGVFKEQGKIDGEFVDIVIKELLLSE
ncbi:arsinothricin resistance N-acetyltransferase ArsN1 family A [Macrococcoides caseolyticum]|uniref:arsinothricin resistance N-acetyltransferase ArsN1 family A n=1 Tax=Macrococcoides caseolyticum TaxID=69966 RepID=UPI001F45B180|nr:arsinothricin resistance N-acetyltransferase ArsN1 family A [Macrococcus caseolyticus]MCE4956826.1 N-acetyltransferase [Macrococcus caseolyticus]